MARNYYLTPEQRRAAAIERARVWNEQRTAAGLCHRCPRKVDGDHWFCWRCRVELSEGRATARAARKNQSVNQVLDTQQVVNQSPPDRVTGKDGKSYPAQEQASVSA